MAKLNYFIVLVLLLFASSHVYALDVAQLPNVQLTGKGFDILYGYPVANALRGPVLNLVFDNNVQYVGNKQFLLPDNFYVTSTPSSQSTTTVNTYTSLEDISQSLYQSQSSGYEGYAIKGIKLTPGMYHKSIQAETFDQNVNQKMYTTYSYMEVETWKSGVNPYNLNSFTDIFDAHFLTRLTNLPTVFNKDTCATFKTFLIMYGTHFIPEILWGGQVTMSSTYQQELYQQSGATAINNDLSNQFYLSTQQSLTTAQQAQLQSLNQQYKSTTNLVGGDPSQYLPSQWSQWASTVPNNPVPLSMLLIPYDVLILNLDKNKYLNISIALNYAIASYLSIAAPGPPVDVPQGYEYALGTGVIDTKIYLAANNPNTAIYDTLTNSWGQGGPTINGGQSLNIVTYQGAMYMFGGYGSTVCQYYNTSYNIWSTDNIAPMHGLIYNSITQMYNSKAYIIGGWIRDSSGTKVNKNIYYYDLSAIYKTQSSAIIITQTCQQPFSSFLYNHQIYVFCGDNMYRSGNHDYNILLFDMQFQTTKMVQGPDVCMIKVLNKNDDYSNIAYIIGRQNDTGCGSSNMPFQLMKYNIDNDELTLLSKYQNMPIYCTYYELIDDIIYMLRCPMVYGSKIYINLMYDVKTSQIIEYPNNCLTGM